MSFREKINLAALGLLALVYGAYFTSVGAELIGGFEPGAALASTNSKMIWAVGAFVVLFIAMNIVIAIFSHRDADAVDERDRMIEMRGDQRGGFVLAVAALGAMALAMMDYSNVLVANAILAGLVGGEIVKTLSKLVDYRRGMV